MTTATKSLPLSALQSHFIDHLLDNPSAISDYIVSDAHMDAARRLHIYHHAYRARLMEALKENYDKTWTYLGDEQFENACLAYINQTPSTHWNLRYYGSNFPSWLADNFSQDLEVADLASFEYALRDAFDGPDADVMTPEDASRLPAEAWESMRFAFHPTARIIRITHNVIAIWSALIKQEAPPSPEALPAPIPILVWRKDVQPHFRTLDADEVGVLELAFSGQDFSAICEHLARDCPLDVAIPRAGHFLRTWLGDSLLCRS